MKSNIHDLFQEFISECTYIKRLSPETIRSYTQTFTLLHTLIPTLSLNTLTPSMITHFYKLLNERTRIVGKGDVRQGIKTSTMATYWTKLHSFCEWLVVRKHIPHNPCSRMQYRAEVYDDIHFLKKEDVEKIITAIHLHDNTRPLLYKRNLLLFYLLLFCGLRREEVLLLQIRDIDFERNILTIRGETSKSKPSRQVPIHSTLLHHLKEYLKERKYYTTAYLLVSSLADTGLALTA